MPSPFFPIQAKNEGVPGSLIDLILGSFALSSSITAPIVGNYLENIGRRRAFILSLAITGVGIALWGILPYLSYVPFIIISLIGRLLQGMGYCISLVTGLSITASDYSDKTTKVISYMEASGSTGMIAGPIIGAFTFHFLGFVATFLVYAAIFFAIIPLFWVMLGPDRPYMKKVQTYKISVCTLSFKGLIFL